MTTREGWVKVHRTLLDQGLMRNPVLCQFWLWCQLKAAHKPYETTVGFQIVKLKPGEFIFRRRMAEDELGLSTAIVRKCIQFLQDNRQIAVKNTNKFVILTIINWDTCQTREATGEPANKPESRRQRAVNEPATPSTPYIQEDKEEQEDQNIFCAAPEISGTTPQPATPDSGEFKIPLVTLNRKTGRKHEYPVSAKDLCEWAGAYPGVDVPQALRSMRQWCLANPTKCKTAKGVRRFIVNWLDRNQNSGRHTLAKTGDAPGGGALTFSQQEERRMLWGRAKCVLELDGPEKFAAYCLKQGLDEREVTAWIARK